MIIDKVSCYGCGGKDYKSVKLHTTSEILVCKKCGAVMHNTEKMDEEKIRNFYRHEYRGHPTYENLLTTTSKQNFIALFLRDFLKDKKGLICGDVGCATGYVPAWLRGLGHKATGSEYTTTYRRMAEHYYGIPITEELEAKHKYDLISLYHVLEHMLNPFEKLTKLREMLSENGRMLISVPEWFDSLEESSGTNVVSFDVLFHVNHINVFSAQSLKNLFARVGLEIEKEDHITYGQTYLLKKCEPKDIVLEDCDKQAGKMTAIHGAIAAYVAKDYTKALKLWPNFPEAHIALLMDTYGKDADKQRDYIAEVNSKPDIAQCARWRMAVALWHYQHAYIPEALQMFTELAKITPRGDYFAFMGFCCERQGMLKEAMANFNRCAMLNPMRWAEMMNLILSCASRIPTWDERAMQEIKEQLWNQNKGNMPLSPADPVMK